MKIGLILCNYNDIKYLPSCLENWTSFRKCHSLNIACLDACFIENGEHNSTDGSIQLLEQYKQDNKIDFFEILPPGLKEHEARNIALKYLLGQRCDVITSIGSDEFFELSDIDQIFKYVDKEEFIAVFKIHYKNYVFDHKHYLLGFQPNRIWRVNYNKYKLLEFSWDDDILYIDDYGNKIQDKNLPIKTIPNIIIKHFTWNDPIRNKKKIDYQKLHFCNNQDNSTVCSFEWNEESKNIIFNKKYYNKNNIPIPEVYTED